MPRALPIALIALSLGLALSQASAAPKHDKPDRHGSDAGVTVDLRGPSIDIGRVRMVIDENRALLGPADTLPPGIRKNLARGKPLPPGIARRLDNRLLGQLPHYDGYEWRQVGHDVVLFTLATGIIHEVLHNILD